MMVLCECGNSNRRCFLCKSSMFLAAWCDVGGCLCFVLAWPWVMGAFKYTSCELS